MTMEPALLAMLTGGLGPRETMEKIAAQFGALYGHLLPGLLKSETGISAEVSYIGSQSGTADEITAALGPGYALTNASLRNWCPQFAIACGSGLVIALMEQMLGGTATAQQASARPLSELELDLSAMVFRQVVAATRIGVDASGESAFTVEQPKNIDQRPQGDEGDMPVFCTAIRLELAFGAVTSQLVVIVPQRTLLKTVLVAAAGVNDAAAAARQEWAASIRQQAMRSEVTLEARIKLESRTLLRLSQLGAGDVIAFEDHRNVAVTVSANGKDLYSCEFGRAGERYTVRVKDNIDSDEALLEHLTG